MLPGAGRTIARQAKMAISQPIRRLSRSANQTPCVAVLYQAIEPPVINGVRKPMKPGGYRDSGADIAYVLQNSGTSITSPSTNPDPKSNEGWCFPDTEDGILQAIDQGATHLWANTILFASHPLQVSRNLDRHASSVKVIGQPPRLVEQYDDKNFVNDLLRKDGSFKLPKSWLVHSLDDKVLAQDNGEIPFPIVAKPIRGRGSHGVKLCHTRDELTAHLQGLLAESSPVMLEEYLSGQEGTVTVMPPKSTTTSKTPPKYTALPIVVRFNHTDGIAPYNGTVAVTANSRIPTLSERQATKAYANVEAACERVAARLQVTAPIRIDVRQFSAEDQHSEFAIFDVNMKPNMTGPGRPGREDQASLSALAAASTGWEWTYDKLLNEILEGALPLEEVRARQLG